MARPESLPSWGTRRSTFRPVGESEDLTGAGGPPAFGVLRCGPERGFERGQRAATADRGALRERRERHRGFLPRLHTERGGKRLTTTRGRHAQQRRFGGRHRTCEHLFFGIALPAFGVVARVRRAAPEGRADRVDGVLALDARDIRRDPVVPFAAHPAVDVHDNPETGHVRRELPRHTRRGDHVIQRGGRGMNPFGIDNQRADGRFVRAATALQLGLLTANRGRERVDDQPPRKSNFDVLRFTVELDFRRDEFFEDGIVFFLEHLVVEGEGRRQRVGMSAGLAHRFSLFARERVAELFDTEHLRAGLGEARQRKEKQNRSQEAKGDYD